MEPAEQAFQAAEQLVSTLAASPDVNSMVGTISAGRAYWRTSWGTSLRQPGWLNKHWTYYPIPDPLSQSMRSVATGALAKTMFMSGDLDRARQIYDQALEFGRAANNVEMIINTNGAICDVLLEQGKLKQAEQLLLETLPLTRGSQMGKGCLYLPKFMQV